MKNKEKKYEEMIKSYQYFDNQSDNELIGKEEKKILALQNFHSFNPSVNTTLSTQKDSYNGKSHNQSSFHQLVSRKKG